MPATALSKMDIRITETRNADLVYQIACQVLDRISNDDWMAKDESVRASLTKLLVEMPENHTFCVTVNGQCGGCFLCDKKGDETYQVHTMLLIKGHSAIIAGKEAMRQIFALGAKKLISFCPMNRKQVLFFALLCGFKKVSTAVNGWTKNGQKYDLVKVECLKEAL